MIGILIVNCSVRIKTAAKWRVLSKNGLIMDTLSRVLRAGFFRTSGRRLRDDTSLWKFFFESLDHSL